MSPPGRPTDAPALVDAIAAAVPMARMGHEGACCAVRGWRAAPATAARRMRRATPPPPLVFPLPGLERGEWVDQ